MSPATQPRGAPLEERLLVVDPRTGRVGDRRVADLPALLQPGDLLVVNDAATVPASLPAPFGEVRLAGQRADGSWAAVLFGPGDWRARTEDRPPPPALAAGDEIRFADDLSARVVDVAPAAPRLVGLRFAQADAALWGALYRHGRPVQYSYLARPLALWDTQTSFAARPWAVEPPSAGRPLTTGLLAMLRRRGVAIAALTHAAGLSSTGDAALDALLPLPERYEIPAATAAAIARARRVIAVGTTVVRALETTGGAAGAGVTDLIVNGRHRPRVVGGVLTGVHEPGTSHYRLLEAFVPAPILAAATAHAAAAGYLGHEFGDSLLAV